MNRLNIINKLSIIIILSILSLAILLGVYFDNYLKETYFKDARNKIELFFTTIVKNASKTEEDLKSGISFVQSDEKFLASVELINSYQYKKNYNSILLDEEKKILVSKLFDKVKLSFNDGMVVYDKNQELIAYIIKKNDKFILNFVSFENEQPFLYSKEDSSDIFEKKELIKSEMSYLHSNLNKSNLVNNSKLITYHINDKDHLVIKSHLNLTDENGEPIAYIEMFKELNKEFFSPISQTKEITLNIKNLSNISNEPFYTLSDENLLKNLNIQQDNEFYFSKTWIITKDKEVCIEAKLQKDFLLNSLNEVRIEMVIIILVITIIMLLILKVFFYKFLTKPLEFLMKQISKIEKADYSNIKVLDSKDELQVISQNINNLAIALNFREKELEATYNNLLYNSIHDSLTGLFNRKYLIDELENSIVKAKKNSSKLAVFFIDLDHFKNINDTLGHDIGDELLKLVAQRLSKEIENAGIIARFGGDEFVVLVQNFDTEIYIQNFATKIIESLQEKFEVLDYHLRISASIGISIFPKDGTTNTELIRQADLAMYYAKEHGKNDLCFFSKELFNNLEEKTQIINALKDAIEDFSEFSLVYQPKYCAKTNKIVSVESLIRWNCKSLGYVTPLKFIKIAEETNIIIPIGEWIFKQACNDFHELLKNGYFLEHMSINVSSIQLRDKRFFSSLNKILSNTQIDPKKIEIEITESFIVSDSKFVLEVLNKIKEIGISLAIDDFGTGYSSLSYLKKLPIDRLKIDKSFVDDLPDSQESISVVKAIISLAKAFELSITAEGVETKKQLDFLVEQNCDEIQGYYFSKPISLEELKKLL